MANDNRHSRRNAGKAGLGHRVLRLVDQTPPVANKVDWLIERKHWLERETRRLIARLRERPEQPVVPAQRREASESATPAPEAMSRAARDWANETLVGVSDFAGHIGVKSGQTVRNRIQRGQLIGWKAQPSNRWVLPAAQLDENGQVWPGLMEIVASFPDHYSAWVWLNQPLAAFDGETPLAALAGGRARAASRCREILASTSPGARNIDD